jgi:2-oxoisovalerate dehydrogenase E1 component
MAAHINAALHDEMLRRPGMLVFGRTSGSKGGVYDVTADLQSTSAPRACSTRCSTRPRSSGSRRARRTSASAVPEIQYLAYVHNALDQLRGEACSLSFFSPGQFTNPMVVRVAGPRVPEGLRRPLPQRQLDRRAARHPRARAGSAGARRRRGAHAARRVALAKACGPRRVFLEPIALYHERDLHEPGDGAWLFDYPPPGEALLPARWGSTTSRARDVLLVSYANGLRLALRAARALANASGIQARVLDVRWLNRCRSSRSGAMRRSAGAWWWWTRCRATGGGIADAVLADLEEHGIGGVRAVRAADSYVPLGAAATSCSCSRRRSWPWCGECAHDARAIVCPGRGSYTEASLGSLPEAHDWVRQAERLRAE